MTDTDKVMAEVASLVRRNGFLPVLRALLAACDHDAVNVPGNLGASVIAGQLAGVVKTCEKIAAGLSSCLVKEAE